MRHENQLHVFSSSVLIYNVIQNISIVTLEIQGIKNMLWRPRQWSAWGHSVPVSVFQIPSPKTSIYDYRVDDIHEFCQTFLEVNHTFYCEARILSPVLPWKESEEFLTLKATLGMNFKHISLQMQCEILPSCAFETTLTSLKI